MEFRRDPPVEAQPFLAARRPFRGRTVLRIAAVAVRAGGVGVHFGGNSGIAQGLDKNAASFPLARTYRPSWQRGTSAGSCFGCVSLVRATESVRGWILTEQSFARTLVDECVFHRDDGIDQRGEVRAGADLVQRVASLAFRRVPHRAAQAERCPPADAPSRRCDPRGCRIRRRASGRCGWRARHLGAARDARSYRGDTLRTKTVMPSEFNHCASDLPSLTRT